jgi:hypothetical protein
MHMIHLGSDHSIKKRPTSEKLSSKITNLAASQNTFSKSRYDWLS